MARSRYRTKPVLLLALWAASCMLKDDELKARARTVLLECTVDDAPADRCSEIAGTAEAAQATQLAASAFRAACGEIREAQVERWASITQVHDSDDGWSWRPGCAVGNVEAERCSGRFRFEVGLTRPGPAIGPVDVITLVAIENATDENARKHERCTHDAEGRPL